MTYNLHSVMKAETINTERWQILVLCCNFRSTFCVHSEMTLLSAQPKPLESAPASAATTEDPEQRMLEKRSKVIEELLQTERDYIKDLNMCKKEIIQPLQMKQVRHDETCSIQFVDIA